jgi:hypothetical protein
MLSALMLGAATTVVLVVVAVWEFIALRRASSGEPVRGDRHATTSADT